MPCLEHLLQALHSVSRAVVGYIAALGLAEFELVAERSCKAATYECSTNMNQDGPSAEPFTTRDNDLELNCLL